VDTVQTVTQTKLKKKRSKYKGLEIAVSRVWKVRTKLEPVIIGALGTTEKGLDQNFQLITGHSWAIELQITLMSTAHIIYKALG